MGKGRALIHKQRWGGGSHVVFVMEKGDGAHGKSSFFHKTTEVTHMCTCIHVMHKPYMAMPPSICVLSETPEQQSQTGNHNAAVTSAGPYTRLPVCNVCIKRKRTSYTQAGRRNFSPVREAADWGERQIKKQFNEICYNDCTESDAQDAEHSAQSRRYDAHNACAASRRSVEAPALRPVSLSL